MALGESFFLNIHKKDLRTSRDWVGNQWIDIQAKPDILSAISATISPDAKMSMSSTITKDMKPSGCDLSGTEGNISAELNNMEEKRSGIATLVSSDSILDMDCNDDRKPSSDNKADEGDGDDVNVGHDELDKVQGNDEDEVDSDVKENDERIDMEVFESSDCKAMEFMEVTA